MNLEIKNGDLLLIKSDSIMVNEDEAITLSFDGQYVLSFRFLEDSTLKEHKINVEPLETEVKLELFNFNNPLGIAIAKPIPFATENEKQFYLSFAVYSVGTAKVFHYNIYKEQ